MSEIVLAIIEATGVGIAVHAWDTGNLEMLIGGLMFSLLFLMIAALIAVEAMEAKDGK